MVAVWEQFAAQDNNHNNSIMEHEADYQAITWHAHTNTHNESWVRLDCGMNSTM